MKPKSAKVSPAYIVRRKRTIPKNRGVAAMKIALDVANDLRIVEAVARQVVARKLGKPRSKVSRVYADLWGCNIAEAVDIGEETRKRVDSQESWPRLLHFTNDGVLITEEGENALIQLHRKLALAYLDGDDILLKTATEEQKAKYIKSYGHLVE